MLYVQKGLKTKRMEPYGETLAYFMNEFIPETCYVDKNHLDEFKFRGCYYGFSGELKYNVRTNENVINRDAIALDLDFIASGLDDFTLYDSLKLNLKCQWWLYPTISNGFKGLRYRLIIPLDTPLISDQDYKIVVFFISYTLMNKGILTRADPSNLTWAQLFGLPIGNQHYPDDLPIIRENQGELFPSTKERVASFKKYLQSQGQPITPDIPKEFLNRSCSYHARTTYTAKLLTDFVKGIPQGSRNNKILELASYLIGIGLNNSNDIYKMLQVFNQNFVMPPLDNQELIGILKSAIRRAERTKRE